MSVTNSNESYCTFTLPSDVAAGGLPSQEEIAKDLESNDTEVRCLALLTSMYGLFERYYARTSCSSPIV
jgi:hypothetical protein